MKMQLIHAKADLRFSHRKITNFSSPSKGFGEKKSFYEKKRRRRETAHAEVRKAGDNQIKNGCLRVIRGKVVSLPSETTSKSETWPQEARLLRLSLTNKRKGK